MWINIAKSPIAIPYPPIKAARMRRIKRIIAPESVCAGTTKLDTAVIATIITMGTVSTIGVPSTIIATRPSNNFAATLSGFSLFAIVEKI